MNDLTVKELVEYLEVNSPSYIKKLNKMCSSFFKDGKVMWVIYENNNEYIGDTMELAIEAIVDDFAHEEDMPNIHDAIIVDDMDNEMEVADLGYIQKYVEDELKERRKSLHEEREGQRQIESDYWAGRGV